MPIPHNKLPLFRIFVLASTGLQNAQHSVYSKMKSPWAIRNAATFFKFQLVMECWNQKPSERPTFDQVTTLLETMLMKDTPYFDPGLLDDSKAYYNVMPEEEIVMETT